MEKNFMKLEDTVQVEDRVRKEVKVVMSCVKVL